MLAAHLDTLRGWGARRWAVAVASTLGTILLIGLPTVLIPNPVFGREIPTTWWNWPALLAAAVLSGLLVATYVRQSTPLGVLENTDTEESGSRRGMIGGVLTFFAVGCPVCNKIVLIALGTSGAMQWFAPVQPLLAVAAVAALVWALHTRLRGERACKVTPAPTTLDPALRS
ncbi:MAG: hypothetical protein ABR500_13095 [Dermatophilaceae bacterium]